MSRESAQVWRAEDLLRFLSAEYGRIRLDMYIEAPKRTLATSYAAFVCAMAWLSCGNSQERHRDIPSNAHSSAGDQGWTCNNGFRQIAGLCMEDKREVPSWSAFEVFDGQWRCRSGYHRSGSICVPSTAPAHAAYIGGGEHWECEWGFQKIAAHCEEIKPPAHAYIDASGRDWMCYTGYDRKSDRCIPAPGTAPDGDTTPTQSEEPRPDTDSPRGKR